MSSKFNKQVKEFLNYLDERFGIKKEIFSDYMFETDGERISIFSAGLGNKNLDGLRIKSIGLRAGKYFKDIRNGRIKFKISTNFAQIFGKYATKNILEISDDDVWKYMQGNDIENVKTDVEEGEVIIKNNAYVLGVGSYIQGRIKNQIPKKRRTVLSERTKTGTQNFNDAM